MSTNELFTKFMEDFSLAKHQKEMRIHEYGYKEEEEPGDPDPEEIDDAQDSGPKGKKVKKVCEDEYEEDCDEYDEEEQGDPDPEEIDDAQDSGPKGKKTKVSEELAKDTKDAIAGKCDSEADDVDDEEIADTEPDESKSATKVGKKGKKMKVSEELAKDTKDAIAGKADAKADDVDDEEIADTEPDETKKALKVGKKGKCSIVEGKTTVTVDWASEERGLDKKLSKQYGITIKDNGRMEATITGDTKKIKAFLLGDDYGMEIDAFNDYYPELNESLDKSRAKRVAEALADLGPDDNRPDMDAPLFVDPTIRGEDNTAIGADLSVAAGRVFTG